MDGCGSKGALLPPGQVEAQGDRLNLIGGGNAGSAIGRAETKRSQLLKGSVSPSDSAPYSLGIFANRSSAIE